MKIFKPAWISHDGTPVLSVDIHPDGTRFATGGQGKDSGRVVIWNMLPVIDEKLEINENVPKMLCQLHNHLACVNCVRWSFSGRFLASGGDDKLVMIWQNCKYPSGGSAVFGGKVNLETWRCVATLRSHHGDVLDVAWSPHDTWLASSSVDNTVIVWDANKFPEVVAVLKGHTGLVKGVTWDPVGKYISSQSDDKTLRIWRTIDWQLEQVISKPFVECSATTLVLRQSWSPDGQYLVSAHSMNNTGPTALIIERDGWSHDNDFVGHRKAVTCVRFNANILQRHLQSPERTQQTCCCAIGSRDASVSIWVTALKRPLVVVEDVFTKPVLDLAWSCSGLQLMACSNDGTVACFEFTEEEMGRPLTLHEKSLLYEKIYGKSLIHGDENSAMVVENCLLLENNTKQREVFNKMQENKEVVSPQKTQILTASMNKQIETRTSDGRRRITPLFIPPVSDSGDCPTPFAVDSVLFSSSSEAKSRIVVEKRDDIVRPNVTPVRQCSLAAPKDKTSHTQLNGPVLQRVPEKTTHSSETAALRKRPLSCFPNTARPLVGEKRISTVVGPARCLTLPQLRMSFPMNITVNGTSQVINVANISSPAGAMGPAAKARLYEPQSTDAVWEVLFGRQAYGCVCNAVMVCVACCDATLHVLDTSTGKYKVPKLVLASLCSFFDITGLSPVYLLSVTTACQLSVWNISGTTCITNTSLESILSQSEKELAITIKHCIVLDNGNTAIALSTGRIYLFANDLNSWLLLSDALEPLNIISRNFYYAVMKSHPESNLMLRSLQSHIIKQHPSQSSLLLTSEMGANCIMAFLDQQLAACLALNSPQEYKFWLLAAVRFILKQGCEPRLRMICQDLLGPVSWTKLARESTWQKSVLGLCKHNLLKEILGEIGSSPHTQRLYMEFTDQLKELNHLTKNV